MLDEPDEEIIEEEFVENEDINEDNPEEEEEAAVISFEECEEKIKLIKREHNKYLKSLNNRKLDPKAQKALDKLKDEFQKIKFNSKVKINKDQIKKEILNNPEEKLLLSEILVAKSKDNEMKLKFNLA